MTGDETITAVACSGGCGNSRDMHWIEGEEAPQYMCGHCVMLKLLGLEHKEKMRLGKLDGQKFFEYRRKVMKLSRVDAARKFGIPQKALTEFENLDGICPSEIEELANEAERWYSKNVVPEDTSGESCVEDQEESSESVGEEATAPSSDNSTPMNLEEELKSESQDSEDSSFSLSSLL